MAFTKATFDYLDSGGLIKWITTAKTSAFTAVSGEGYLVDTSSAAVTVTLPTAPSAGDEIIIVDYASNAGTNNITLDPGTLNLRGATNDLVLDNDNQTARLLYSGATKGWLITTEAGAGARVGFSAIGGTITESGGYTYHTFTSSGTFTPAIAGDIDFLVVAGGGSGGSDNGGANGGGGAGGYISQTAFSVTAQVYTITIGGGGSGTTSADGGNAGTNSSAFGYTANGGGRGGSRGYSGSLNGGSGGGGASSGTLYGSGTTGQGNDGGQGIQTDTEEYPSGGGGGAGEAGQDYQSTTLSGRGGNGSTWLNGTTYAGGGGGGTWSSNGTPGSGGSGGGGNGCVYNINATTANNGDTNTGGGGGGGGQSLKLSGTGGSGIVIIRY